MKPVLAVPLCSLLALLAAGAEGAESSPPAGAPAASAAPAAAPDAPAPAPAPTPDAAPPPDAAPAPAAAPSAAPAPVAAPSAAPAPVAEADVPPPFDLVQTPWGPGRRSSGETFRSQAELLPPGPLRLRGEKWSLGFGAQYLARGELRDNADFTTSREDHALTFEQRVRVTVRANAWERVGVLIELQDVRGWGTEKATNLTEPLTGLHQGFVDLKAASWLHFRVGRQELAYGEERLLGALDWSQHGRAFDGLFARVAAGDKVTVDTFAMMLKPPEFIDPGAGAPRFHNSGSYLYGGYGRFRLVPAFGFDVYAIGLSQDPGTAATGFTRDTNLATFGARLVVKAGKGFAAVGEGALQLGSSAAGDVAAGAFAARASYKLPVWGEPYVQLELLAASGDGDQSDGRVSTFSQLFPTGHAHLGYLDYVGWQNVWSFKGTVGFRPWGAHVWLDVHHFRQADPRGAWFNAAGAVFRGADPSRTDGAMGTELDLSVTVPITRYASVAGAYGIFLPGGPAALAPIAEPWNNPSHWVFLYIRTQF